jgi:hypothetical protein
MTSKYRKNVMFMPNEGDGFDYNISRDFLPKLIALFSLPYTLAGFGLGATGSAGATGATGAEAGATSGGFENFLNMAKQGMNVGNALSGSEGQTFSGYGGLPTTPPNNSNQQHMQVLLEQALRKKQELDEQEKLRREVLVPQPTRYVL